MIRLMLSFFTIKQKKYNYIISPEKMKKITLIRRSRLKIRRELCIISTTTYDKENVIMYRFLIEKLKKWKDSPKRKPLILWGARQVGKTYLMKSFGDECFENMVYISLYKNQRIADIFSIDYDTKRIIKSIELELNVKIDPDKTLIIFDEVQNAPAVVESLKYFCEDAREYALIAAGSLLGVALHENVSFPVGKVDELHLYPMSFMEYLIARSEQELAECVKDYRDPVLEGLAGKCHDYLKEYYVVGGMPEAVSTFIETEDYDSVREVQNSILNQYEGDFGKHVKANELPRIHMVWNSLPAQLAKENKKFFFGQIKAGARAKEFEIALQWLKDSGLVHMVYKVSKPGIPLKAYLDMSNFKVYMLDVGLLGALAELDVHTLLKGNAAFTEFKGALTEQYVLQQIIAETRYTPYYYSGEKSTYETDFLIQKDGDIAPIEVKAEENVRSKSLKTFCDKFNPPKAYRISMKNYYDQGWMVNIPLWGIGGL